MHFGLEADCGYVARGRLHVKALLPQARTVGEWAATTVAPDAGACATRLHNPRVVSFCLGGMQGRGEIVRFA